MFWVETGTTRFEVKTFWVETETLSLEMRTIGVLVVPM
jgi:hypothetical protein